MTLKRILKMLAAMITGQGVTLLSQFLLPPAFIHYYGLESYGEWLVLSATVIYMSTLNFGITTYASNELTMLRGRGEMGRYKVLHASSAMLLTCLSVGGLAVLAGIMLLPLKEMLHLRMEQTDLELTVLFLGLQALLNIIVGYYNQLFMVEKLPHRGMYWVQLRRFAIMVVIPIAFTKVSFSWLAFWQFAALLVASIASVIDLKRVAPELPLGLSGWSWPVAKSTLKPGGMFLLIYMQNMLLFQAPVIIFQRLLGPEVVVMFTVSRTLFATSRQILSTVTNAISPEITFSYGGGHMEELLAIFHYSEKIVFSLIPVGNIGLYVLSPLLINVWLHKPFLFDPYLYGLMAIISGAMSMKEHKQFFQFSTNEHRMLSYIMFGGNVLLILIGMPLTARFGLTAFLWAWLVAEFAQMILIYVENKKLFDAHPSITTTPVLKVFGMMIILTPLCYVLLDYITHFGYPLQAAVGVAVLILLTAISYFLFGVDELKTRLVQHLRPAA